MLGHSWGTGQLQQPQPTCIHPRTRKEISSRLQLDLEDDPPRWEVFAGRFLTAMAKISFFHQSVRGWSQDSLVVAKGWLSHLQCHLRAWGIQAHTTSHRNGSLYMAHDTDVPWHCGSSLDSGGFGRSSSLLNLTFLKNSACYPHYLPVTLPSPLVSYS